MCYYIELNFPRLLDGVNPLINTHSLTSPKKWSISIGRRRIESLPSSQVNWEGRIYSSDSFSRSFSLFQSLQLSLSLPTRDIQTYTHTHTFSRQQFKNEMKEGKKERLTYLPKMIQITCIVRLHHRWEINRGELPTLNTLNTLEQHTQHTQQLRGESTWK